MMNTERTMQELSMALRGANDNGVQYKTIADESGVARASVSQLANKGAAIISAEKQQQQWAGVARSEARRQPKTAIAQDIGPGESPRH